MMAKKLSDYIPIFADQGIDYVAAAPAAGVATQYQVVSVSGASQTVTLANQMANADYAVMLTDDKGTTTAYADTKTVTSFSAKGLANPSTLNVIVVGQLKGQK
jgi:hypothetical protein